MQPPHCRLSPPDPAWWALKTAHSPLPIHSHTMPAALRACSCCGLVHRLPDLAAAIGGTPGSGPTEARCTRCRTVIRTTVHPRSVGRTAAIALSALILYPLALTLPVMRVERLGHAESASIWGGMVDLLAEGHLFVGLAVLLFSIVSPIGKLALLFALCAGDRLLRPRHRAATYHLVEFLGRWGMADVLLVALVVAIVKLGDLVEVEPGPGVVVFGAVVILSLLASAVFDPRAIWDERT